MIHPSGLARDDGHSVLPTQWGRGRIDTPARRLWVAVLEQVFHDRAWLRGTRDTKLGRTMRHDLERWMLSESRRAGSLHWICDHLNLPVRTVRRAWRRS